MTALKALFVRDVRIAMRIGGGAMIGVLFFMSVVTLMPFAIGPDLALLQRIGPAILWLGALLASLLALDRLLSADQEDGSLDLLVMGTAPLELAVAVKALAHWLTTALPLVAVTPLLSLFLNLDLAATAAVAATLLVGTPALTFIGLIGAGLTVTLRRGGLLLPVLILPLAVPVLIFGVSASNAAVVGPVPFGTPFTILCALTLLSLFLNLDLPATAAVTATLLVGTPALTFIGLIGAGLTVTLRRGGLLLPVLILPLAVPVLIFGVSASNAAVIGPVPFGTPFTILCALTLMSLVVGPFAAAAALRAGQE
jgi:heme exporter protein B